MKKNISAVFLILFLPFYSLNSLENEINLSISADKNTVTINEVFQITLTISGNTENLKIHEIDNLDPEIYLKRSGMMTNFSIINGEINSSQIYTYYCKIMKTGEFNIGPFIIQSESHLYQSEILKISVTTPAEKKSDNMNAVNIINENPSITEDRHQLYIIEAVPSKKEVFVNEYFDVQVNFYLGTNYFRQKNYIPLNFPPTAWIEKLESPEYEMVEVQRNQKTYYKNELENKRVYITKPGLYQISSASYEFIGINSLDIIGTGEKMILKTLPFTINVKPLPENAPQDFNGAVGSFKLNTKLHPAKVHTKEAATLEIKLEGDGNFQTIPDINFKIDDSVEVFSTKSNIEKENKVCISKNWDIVLIPSKSGNFPIKFENFVYFDLFKHEYIALNNNNLIINVEKEKIPVKEDEMIASVSNDRIKTISKEITQFQYIKLTPGHKNDLILYNFWLRFIITIYVIILGSIGLFILVKYIIYKQFINKNELKKKYAYKDFLRHINNLKHMTEKKNIQSLIDYLSETIEKYFSRKFELECIELTSKCLLDKLNTVISEETIQQIKDTIMQIDMIRFGSHNPSKKDIVNMIEQVNTFIKKIEFNEN